MQRDERQARRSVSQPADDSDLPRHRLDRRVRRPRHGRRPAAEISEFAGDADLLEGPDALRAAPEQDGDHAQLEYAVLVEGYFDFAQVFQAGITTSSPRAGTALTPRQAQLLRRFTAKVVLSFDPDAAGQGARRGRASCWSPKASRSTSPCCRRATIPTRSSGSRARRPIRNSCGIRGRTSSTCWIGRPPGTTCRQDDSRREFLERDADGGGPNSGRRGARPVRGPAGPQGADYRRGRPGRDSEGGGRAADRPSTERWRVPLRASSNSAERG